MTSPIDSSKSEQASTAPTRGSHTDLSVFPFHADGTATRGAFENAVSRFVPGVLQNRLPALIETLGAKPSVALWRLCSAVSHWILVAVCECSWPDLLKGVGRLVGVKFLQLSNYFFERAFALRCLNAGLVQSRYLALEAERNRLQAQQMVIDAQQRDVDVVVDLGSQGIAKQLYARFRRLIGGR